jgi:disulfide bond formation protein DsbB
MSIKTIFITTFLKLSVYGLLLASAICALFFAYVSQYFFGLQPCILCHYQRIVFWLIALHSAVFLWLQKYHKLNIVGQVLAILFLLGNITIAGFHSGVERKIFFLSSCAATNEDLNKINDPNLLLATLQQTQAVRCDQPQFQFLGFSMADYNVFYCLFLLVLTIFLLKKNDKKRTRCK